MSKPMLNIVPVPPSQLPLKGCEAQQFWLRGWPGKQQAKESHCKVGLRVPHTQSQAMPSLNHN
eukprot:1927553-Prorocentrum_lima.AAC.1